MKYLKYTYVDVVTGVPVTVAPAANGPVFPAVPGIEFVWARESQYPTTIPEFFGTCPESSKSDVPGVIAEMSQQEWEAARADEMATRAKRLIQSIVDATQARLDDFARTRNYDSILSLCTYATSTLEKFRVEGQYGVDARDATWGKVYQILADIDAGVRPAPNGFYDIESELPVLAWPA